MIPVRLACVKHAASVRPEPGSNSDVQSFSVPRAPLNRSPKRFRFPQDPAFLSQKSDCFVCLVSFRCIVLKDRAAVVSRSIMGYYSNSVEICQAILATSSRYNTIL